MVKTFFTEQSKILEMFKKVKTTAVMFKNIQNAEILLLHEASFLFLYFK